MPPADEKRTPIHRLIAAGASRPRRDWDFAAATWGEAQALRYARLLQAAADAVAADPAKGQLAEDVRPGYFRFAAGSHVLFFRQTDIGIDIVRILHKRMDFGRHL